MALAFLRENSAHPALWEVRAGEAWVEWREKEAMLEVKG